MKEKTVLDYFKSCLTTDYSNFKGRARRKEYWGYILFNFLISSMISIIDKTIFGIRTGANFTDFLTFNTLGVILLFIPTMAVLVRRYHDTNRRGWFAIIMSVLTLSFLVFPLAMQRITQRVPAGISEDPIAIAILVYGALFLLGSLATLIVALMEGTHGSNRFGPDPKNPENEIDALGTE